jgi:hypothetical protein
MGENLDSRGMHLASRLIVEVRHVRVAEDSWAPKEGEQDV